MSFTVESICVIFCYVKRETIKKTYEFLKLIFKDEELRRSTAFVTYGYVLKTVENREKTTIALPPSVHVADKKVQRSQHRLAVRSRTVAIRNSVISVGLSFRT